jgi:lantibiotic modifying enzyme
MHHGTHGAQGAAGTGARGAHSVYGFLARRAERVADGVRWETLDWHNRPQHTPVIFTGQGGISFFLADYHRLTGSAEALDLAVGAVRWCAGPERSVDPDWEWCRNGIMRGRSGLGLAWLHLGAATGDGAFTARAAAVGDALLREPVGPVTDWQDGAAGEALFLLRLGEAAREPRFLEGAAQRAAWLEEVAIRERVAGNGGTGGAGGAGGKSGAGGADGCYWPWQTDHEEYARWFGLSFVPGSAGIAYVLLALFQVTGEARWARLARAAGETLARQAVPDRGGLNWPDTLDGLRHGEELKCQWCYGASGVGLLFCRAHEALRSRSQPGPQGPERREEPDRPGYLAIAGAAGETTYAYGDARRNPCLCHGLAGSVELFLELHRLTGEDLWQARAAEFADLMLGYRTEQPDGDVWQSDDPGCSSPDFLYGVAGTGHTFLRLWRPDVIRPPLL